MLKEYRQGRTYYNDVAQTVKNGHPQKNEDPIQKTIRRIFPTKQESEKEKPNRSEDGLPFTRPFDLDFDALFAINPDVIGWIYCEDTFIDYPIVQAADNDYYLRRMLNGQYNYSGSIFMDYRCSPDFSDSVSIVYGHNMKNSSMFGELPRYMESGFYEEHPEMWLLLPEKTFRIALVCGFEVSQDSKIYQVPKTEQEMEQWIKVLQTYRSSFDSGIELQTDDRAVILSTCTYSFEESRYVLIGKLMETEQNNQEIFIKDYG